jgi:SNF2 family DNA or RNA helicase
MKKCVILLPNKALQKASDRVRLGQDKPVFVYKLIIANSIEEKIMELQAKKQKLADALFDASQETQSLKITENDIQTIFNMPLGGFDKA